MQTSIRWQFIDRAYRRCCRKTLLNSLLVLLCDKPNADRETDYQRFRTVYKALVDGGQIIEAPHSSLEECYPEPWKKSAEEVKQLLPGGKVELANLASQAITQVQLEKEMPHIHRASQKAWDNAHK